MGTDSSHELDEYRKDMEELTSIFGVSSNIIELTLLRMYVPTYRIILLFVFKLVDGALLFSYQHLVIIKCLLHILPPIMVNLKSVSV